MARTKQVLEPVKNETITEMEVRVFTPEQREAIEQCNCTIVSKDTTAENKYMLKCDDLQWEITGDKYIDIIAYFKTTNKFAKMTAEIRKDAFINKNWTPKNF